MGTLILELGQCGNQIGLQLWDHMESVVQTDNNYLYRRDQNIAHSIHIDTEPKVLKNVLDNRKLYQYLDIKNVILAQSGRANNWALGYYDTKNFGKRLYTAKNTKISLSKPNAFGISIDNRLLQKDKLSQQQAGVQSQQQYSSEPYFKENYEILDHLSELIRKEIEKTDYYLGTMMFYSLGGGTGSGLGSRLLEELYDEYFSGGYLFNTVVEIDLFGYFIERYFLAKLEKLHYSIIIASFLQVMRKIMLIQFFISRMINVINIQLTNVVLIFNQKQIINYQGKIDDAMVNIHNINEYIASIMTHLLKINDFKSIDRFYQDILSELTPLPEMKFLEIYSSPYKFNKKNSITGPATWEAIFDNCIGQANFEDDEGMEEKKGQQKEKGAFNSGAKNKFDNFTLSQKILHLIINLQQ